MLEPFYSFQQIGELLGVSRTVVTRLFRKRAIDLSAEGCRATYRVPASALLGVMRERGYTNEQAERILRRGNAA